jgi:glycosyltransferase involved in cell wall biosynthesis
MKIIFCGTYTGLSTGYAKISHSITNFLCKHHEVYHVAFQAYDDIERESDPSIKVLKQKDFGYENILEYVKEIKPDVVIIYNDVIVCSHYINEFLKIKKNFKLIIHLDLTYKGTKYIPHLNKLTDTFVCFNKSWERYLLRMNIPAEKLASIEHEIYVTDNVTVKESREYWGIESEDFVVLNLNRNSYRKLLDVTIDAFLEFFKENDHSKNIKLFLGCKFSKKGWIDVQDTVLMYARLHAYSIEQIGFLMNNCILRTPTDHMSDESVKMLYKACDVGINTCAGEGYGLCNIEHQLYGKPQILTQIDNFRELFDETWCKFLPVKARIAVGKDIDGVGGILEIPDARDAAKALDFYYKNPATRVAHGRNGKRHFEENGVDMRKWLNVLI